MASERTIQEKLSLNSWVSAAYLCHDKLLVLNGLQNQQELDRE
jgi:hypothetical protein